MTVLKQIAAVTILNIKSLPSRLWSSLVIVVGMTAVIAVLLSMLSLNAGIDAQVKAGDSGRAMILGNGPENEYESSLSRDQAALVMDAPGIRKDNDGTPLAEGEILISAPALRKTGIPTYLTIHGFGPKGFALRPELKLIAGLQDLQTLRRMGTHGGKGRWRPACRDANRGDKVILPDGTWPVVGVFSAGGDTLEVELIADRDMTLMNSVKLDNFNIGDRKRAGEPGCHGQGSKPRWPPIPPCKGDGRARDRLS